MTLQECLLICIKVLKAGNINNYKIESRIILKHVLNIEDADFLLLPNQEISKDKLIQVDDIIKNRLLKRPLAYLINKQFFWETELYVNESVLIPRFDSETLIEAFLKVNPQKNKTFNILEIGVGSGCLILSILKEYRNAMGIGVDISSEALEVFSINIQSLGLNNRCRYICSDVFSCIDGKYDFIISNPPYIDIEDQEISDDVKRYEPSLALFASNKGLFFYQKILNQAKKYLKKEGLIFFEIGYKQKEAVIEIGIKNGFDLFMEYKDISSKDRVLVFQLVKKLI